MRDPSMCSGTPARVQRAACLFGWLAVAALIATLHETGQRLEVRPHGDGGVDIADWAVYRNSPGVVLTSHGFSGAQVGIMDRWDWNTVASQLAGLDPSLILVAFGTNEGYAPKSRLQNYENALEAYPRLKKLLQ